MAKLREGYVDSVVTLIRRVSTLTIHCGSKFRIMAWQFYIDIFQGVYIPAGKDWVRKETVAKYPKKIFLLHFREKRSYSQHNTSIMSPRRNLNNHAFTTEPKSFITCAQIQSSKFKFNQLCK